MKSKTSYQFGMGLLVGVFIMIVFVGGALSERIWGLSILKNISKSNYILKTIYIHLILYFYDFLQNKSKKICL